MDDGQAEPVEGGHDRQQHRVGVRRHQPDDDVRGDDQRGQPAAVRDDAGRAPRPARRGRPRRRRPRPTASASTSRNSSAPRAAPVDEAHERAGLLRRTRRSSGVSCVAARFSTVCCGVVEGVGVDALADLAGLVVRRAGRARRWRTRRGARSSTPGRSALQAAVDHHDVDAVLVRAGADEELPLAPGPRRGHAHPHQADQHGGDEQPPGPDIALAARAGRSAPPRGRRDRPRWRSRRPRGSRPGSARARRCRPSGARGTCPAMPAMPRLLRPRRGRSAAAPTSSGAWSAGSSPASTTSATMQVTLSLEPASSAARTSSTAA